MSSNFGRSYPQSYPHPSGKLLKETLDTGRRIGYAVHMDFGHAIVLRRTAMRMDRGTLAIKSGLSYPYLAEVENNVKLPTGKMGSLMAALGVSSPQELMRWAQRVTETI